MPIRVTTLAPQTRPPRATCSAYFDGLMSAASVRSYAIDLCGTMVAVLLELDEALVGGAVVLPLG